MSRPRRPYHNDFAVESDHVRLSMSPFSAFNVGVDTLLCSALSQVIQHFDMSDAAARSKHLKWRFLKLRPKLRTLRRAYPPRIVASFRTFAFSLREILPPGSSGAGRLEE